MVSSASPRIAFDPGSRVRVWRSSLSAYVVMVGLASGVFGCAPSSPFEDAATTGGPVDGPKQKSDGICLLHNCHSDSECDSCDGERNTCLVEEGRCVACDANTNTGCPSGQTCSSWGNCVPDGLVCPTDTHERSQGLHVLRHGRG